jgi:hypothetical protein
LSPKLNYKTKPGPKDKSCWAPSLILQSPNRHPKSASLDREKSAKLRPRSKTREREREREREWFISKNTKKDFAAFYSYLKKKKRGNYG